MSSGRFIAVDDAKALPTAPMSTSLGQTNSGLGSRRHVAQGPQPSSCVINGSIYHQKTDGSNLAPDLGNNGFQGSAGLPSLRAPGQRGLEGPSQRPISGPHRSYTQGTFQGYISHSAAVSRDFL